ncbi:MAG: hypothetical protein VW397_08125, partial [Candidatus Margulisiibacteriota bacterium]
MSSCISFGSPHGSHFSDRSSVSHYALNRRGDRRGLDGGNDLQDPRNIRSGYRIVHTSGNNLKCGYYALGIGILGMSQERRNSIYDIIGVDQNSTVRTAAPPYSQTQLNAFQMEVGDALYEYARQNRESILRNLDLDPNVLNIAHFETMGDTYIQADYLVAIGISLGIKTILYNHDHNEGDVYIRNLSSHYEGMLPENVLMSDPLNCLSPSASISKGNDKSGFYLGSGTISLRDSFRHVLVKGRTGMGATSRIFIPGILALNDENALVTDI